MTEMSAPDRVRKLASSILSGESKYPQTFNTVFSGDRAAGLCACAMGTAYLEECTDRPVLRTSESGDYLYADWDEETYGNWRIRLSNIYFKSSEIDEFFVGEKILRNAQRDGVFMSRDTYSLPYWVEYLNDEVMLSRSDITKRLNAIADACYYGVPSVETEGS